MIASAEWDAFLAAEGLPASAADSLAQVFGRLSELAAERHAALGRPVLVGLCGPQGSGKSTGVKAMRLVLQGLGSRVASLSIDDVYLTRAERMRLAVEVHPLLMTRGPPGTHDVALAEQVIARMLAGERVALPSFDKASDDRRPPGEWLLAGPADIVLFEGWCVGARPQPPEALASPVNELERLEDAEGVWRRFVNDALAGYQTLFSRIDLFVLLRPPSFEVVAGWRREQEAKLRARSAGQAGARTMGDAEVDRFVAHYERLTRWIMAEAPERADVVVELGPAREPRRLTINSSIG